jgi:iron-sulfur cluster insertion protein
MHIKLYKIKSNVKVKLNERLNMNMKLTENAKKKVKELLETENENMKLRVYISGGGCSGFEYGFTLDDKENPDDIIFEKEDSPTIIDPLSIQYLFNSTIDFVDGLQGSRFVINNPNATTTCGCGSSFSV